MSNRRRAWQGVWGLLGTFTLVPSIVLAQDANYRFERLEEPPPPEISNAIRNELNTTGYRITKGESAPYLDVWLRKAIPSNKVPAGPEGPVQLPYLSVGELLGAVRFAGEGHDFRDQTLVKGTYTLRYNVHPIDGNHLGVSPFRDFSLLLLASKDTSPAPVKGEDLLDQSAMVSGTEHPAVLMLSATKPGTKVEAGIRNNAEKKWWSLTLPLTIAVDDQASPSTQFVELIFDGVAEM
jgi:hypothetical protein